MSNPSEIIEKLKKIRAGLGTSELPKIGLVDVLLSKLQLIEQMLMNIQLRQELESKPQVHGTTKPEASQSDLSLAEKKERLKDVAVNKMEDDKLLFLLHRPTLDFEYENCINGSEFVTKEDTEWIADFEESTVQRIGTNPVVAVWVPAENIKDVPNAFGSENNTWGELGTNPNKNRYRVIIVPGKYKLYQELKKSQKNYNSLWVLQKSIETLKKNSQFTEIDPKLLELGNESGDLSIFFNKEKAERQLTEGKLNPKDIDKIIENRNLDLHNILMQRADLTKDQLLKMISHDDEFAPGHDRRRDDQQKVFYMSVYQRLKDKDPDFVDHLIKEGNDNALIRTLNKKPDAIRGEHLFKLITERPDLYPITLSAIVSHKHFDSGHAIELLKSPHVTPILEALHKLQNKNELDPNVLNAALADKRSELIKGILTDSSIQIPQNKIRELFNHSDNEIRAAAAGRITDPASVDHVINNMQNLPNHKDIFDKLVTQENLGYRPSPELSVQFWKLIKSFGALKFLNKISRGE
ncbi:MAG: hypothetical protein QXL01_00425 [Thermoplasmatales archaeon]